MSSPGYTVVIPAYNASRYLGETLRSVLQQSVPPAKVLVVDDGSTDDTAGVAKTFGDVVEVITTSNHGSGPATTTGIRQVTTAVVATVDSDDLWFPDKIERQLAILTDDKTATDAVLTKMEPFGRLDLKTANIETSAWSRSTLLTWTATFDRVGPVENMGNGYGEMIDWFARARDAGVRFHVLDEVLARRRIHPDSLSFVAGKNRDTDYLQAAVRALRRKRDAGL